MTGIVSRIPFALGKATSGGSATAAPGTVAYDFAIGGQTFISAFSDDRPYIRSLAPIRKEQFDNAREPGEQSLANWWLRAQSTFIGGEGLLYQDPDLTGQANLQNRHTVQYGSSVGLNPWVNGELSLLRATTLRVADNSGNNHYVLGWSNAGVDSFYSAFGNTLDSDDGTTTTAVTWGGANTIRSLTGDGLRYYAADNVNVYRGTGTGVGAALCATGTTNVVVRWAKGRLMLAQDNLIYEVDNAGAKTLKFTHLNPGFTFTDFAEGTNAIYASGVSGNQSQIYKLVLDTTGAVPALASGGSQAAQMPLGETVLSLNVYLGTFVGIGTNRGFRVGQIDDNGDIVYGPLIVQNANGVRAIGAYDRFFFVGFTDGIQGNGGLCRVDLSQPIYDAGVSASLRFAYATDLQTHQTGAITGVTNFGTSDRMVIGQVGRGSYLENAAVLEPTGFFTTGRIRYNTLEPKIFKFLTVRMPLAYKGALVASITEPAGATTSVLSVTEGSGIHITDIYLPAPTTAVEWVQLRLDFTRSTIDTTTGPEVNGWQFKALPGSIRQRVFVVPLLCFDREKDNNGQWDGREGRCLNRLETFEALAQKGDSVSFQDMNLGLSYTCVVDDYEFKQSAQPANNGNGYGGYLTVQLRTIADVVT